MNWALLIQIPTFECPLGKNKLEPENGIASTTVCLLFVKEINPSSSQPLGKGHVFLRKNWVPLDEVIMFPATWLISSNPL